MQQNTFGSREATLTLVAPASYLNLRGNLRSQASRLALRSAIGIAAAAGVSLLAPGQAWAACTVGAVTVQCDNTSTTDTTFPANAPDDRNYQGLLPVPITVTVDPGTTVNGNGLAVSNTGNGGVTITNNGAIAVDVGNTPTAGGTAALSVSAAGGAIIYTGGSITNNGAGNAFDVTQTGGVGSVNLNVTGNVSAATGEGIVVRDVTTSTGISVTANNVTALTAGKDAIDVQSQSLTGNVTEVANGNLQAGNAAMVAAIL
ncbi:autotransporter outer membrane beta-barrel domain-containing protein, partial [Mesorhizobium qingshengii]|nr:autotransporter outer membrane beta-barrel domain-containing protein [Mesorhizobium qingshengii]